MAAFNFPNSPSVNDTHTENGVTFKWDGEIWKRAGIAGAQGAQGHQGVQGATGAQGHQGVQGATGAQGHQGVQGAQGAQGATGAQGHQGVQGAQGATGAQGHQGVQGAPGPQGAQGHQGVQGAGGGAGSQGHQGVQGAQGHQGVQGAGGGAGAQGAQGHQGVQGAQGHQGNQGSEGVAGLTIATSPPGSPDVGDMWWDSDDGDLHVWYSDGNSNQWVATSQGPMGHQGVQGAQGASGSATISNNADNRVITGGSGSNLNGEANLTFDGTDLFVANDIKHLGDTDTYIEFTADKFRFITGGKSFLNITQSGASSVVINEQNNYDCDFRVEGQNDTHLIFTDAANDRVGFSVGAPTEKVHIDGNVRITGAIKDHNNHAGSAGQVLSSTGTQLDWVNPTPTASFVSYAILKHVESSGTHAGGSTSSWGTRPLNQETADPHNIVTLSSNQFTLGAGNYLVKFGATNWDNQDCCLRIYDVTNSASRGESANGYGSSFGERNTWTVGITRLTPSGTTVYRLECISDQARGTYGWGHSNSLGSTEEYAQVEIYMEG